MNTKASWIVEDFMMDGKAELISDEIKKQGMVCEIVKYVPMETTWKILSKFEKSQCVIFLGSINMTQSLQRNARWIPGTWSNFNALKCSSYYAHLGKHLFNKDYIIAPAGDFLGRPIDFFNRFGDDNNDLFIRPDACTKSFTGQTITRENYNEDLKWVREDTSPEDLIVVASPKNIMKEFRFFITKDEVITGCTYKVNRRHSESADYDQGAYDLALEIARGNFQPDPIWVVDIALDRSHGYNEERYSVLEIGGFSCAGQYKCDIEKLVSKASKLAVDEWTEYMLQ